MKPIEVTDELLYKYVPIADEMELDALEAELNDDIEFSEKFKKKMKRLMWKQQHRWLIGFGKFMGKVAIVVICILGLSLTVTMSVDAYRSKFFQTVQEFLDDSVKHTYDTGEDEQGFVPHEPTYIPEGYVEVERIEVSHMHTIRYEDNMGNRIVWDQNAVVEGSHQVFDVEYISKETQKTKKGIVTIFYYEEGYIKVYLEETQYVIIVTANNIDKEELCKMLESIK